MPFIPDFKFSIDAMKALLSHTRGRGYFGSEDQARKHVGGCEGGIHA